MYMSVRAASEKWNISERRVRMLCEQEKIEGVIRIGRSWSIPNTAVKPVDGKRHRKQPISFPVKNRESRSEQKSAQIDQLLNLLCEEADFAYVIDAKRSCDLVSYSYQVTSGYRYERLHFGSGAGNPKGKRAGTRCKTGSPIIKGELSGSLLFKSYKENRKDSFLRERKEGGNFFLFGNHK
ncbi:MAG: hypothetical protein PHP50_03130 [Lachnospiraceae bacterium]|nr:hypothetical protein [Lachnospiraceae bacterium]